MPRFTRIVSLCVCLLLFAVTFASCTEKPDMPTDGVYIQKASNISGACRFMAHGDYVYYSGRYVMKYNYLTGECTRACTAPDHPAFNCPMDSVLVCFSDFSTGILYLSAFGHFEYGDCFYYASFDPASGSVKILREFQGNEVCYETPSLDGGYLYYTHNILKEGGDAAEPTDYIPTVCRVSVEGGAEEVLLPLESERLCTVYNGRAILFDTLENGQVYYAVDLATKEKTVLMDVRAEGYEGYGSNGCVYDGKMYAWALDGSRYKDEYVETINCFLVSLDLETGEVRQVVREPISNFFVNEEGIYYTLNRPQLLYVPQNPDDPEDVKRSLSYAPDLHFCRLDGSEDRVVYSRPGFDYAGYDFLVVRGKLIGSFSEYLEDTHRFSEDRLGALDLKSGEITYFHSDETDNS